MYVPTSRAWVVALVVLVGACAGEREDEPELAAIGENCELSSDCAEALSCVHLICLADDSGPAFEFDSPFALDTFSPGLSSLSLLVNPDELDTQLELSVHASDLGGLTHELTFETIPHSYFSFPLEPPLASGPHHLRGRLLQPDGTPYENHEATQDVVFFVRDAEIPTTPQLAIVWPPPGYEHPAGRDLEVEVAVLPGSFTFSKFGEECEPIPGCVPSFAPECEDTCGPVSRAGNVKLYVDDEGEFPGCLEIEKSTCGWDYIYVMPGSQGAELVDGHFARGVILGERLPESGSFSLHAVLSYPSHLFYPSEAELIYNTVDIEIIAD